MSNTTTTVTTTDLWWKTAGHTYTNKDTGAFGTTFSEGNWFLHVLPGLICGIVGLIFVVFTYNQIRNYEVKNDAVKKLGVIINQGAKDFLTAEYKWLLVFVTFIFVAVSCLF
mgnify:FL=1|jgi:hypothetical protein